MQIECDAEGIRFIVVRLYIKVTEVNQMDKNKDLAEKIYWILIEEGQHNLKFPLGSIITNTPDEVRDIIRKHIKDLT